MKLRFAIYDLRLPILVALLFYGRLSNAQSTNSRADDIPPLAPPLPEIPPSLAERFGWTLWILIPLVMVLVMLGIWLYVRPGKPPALPAPAAQARSALRSLQAKPEDGDVLSQVSQALRRYFINTYWLPPQEMTTHDFCVLLAQHEQIGPGLAGVVSTLLRSCDERKFAPATNSPPLGAAGRALELVERVENARIAALNAARTAKPA